ncbi:putative RNA polymerase II transcription factor B subunit 1 [Daldinia childiae]|uniref:putative RNA polymerase II transcription factor B subunit 1 n=1 Tax=Daldinia childiae TaxID=326645 RepID=UPI001444F149|nr:putative RNA polymerase II transcription factor B subunit 1 [Daldinia childiae]KAF3070880.1 putative RNA polymerase II transcription factor B subunit 1 [Daldinia childiae]
MAIPTGAAAYKKKDGILTLTPDRKNVIWTPNSAPMVHATISLKISNITNLQQTPDTAAKVMLKIFDKPSENAEPVAYLFHFNSPSDPRAEANVIRDLLSKILAETKNNDPSVPRAATTSTGGSGSASMTFANTAVSKSAAALLFDDDALKSDITLQQSLMKADRNLSQMYMEGRRMKPDSISDATFNTQFWTARINLLRSHAIENSQKKGPYNVLAQVRPTAQQSTDPDKPSELKLKFSVEQMQMIFSQHPLVKRIYNENVPPLEQDNKFLAQHVPHMIDIEGNEENQGGFRSGNRKDVEMRPRGRKDVPIIQTLNSISEKLLSTVVSFENDSTQQAELDDDSYRELALRDLRGDIEENRIILNIKEQSRFFSSNETATISETAAVYAKQNTSEVLKDIQGDVRSLNTYSAGGVDLHASLGINDDSDSEDEGGRIPHVGSRASRKSAQKQILENAVAAEAEAAREAQIKKRKDEIIRIYEQTKRKIKFNSKSVRGGKEAVLKLMEPTIQSLDKAIADYQRALAAEGIQVSTERLNLTTKVTPEQRPFDPKWDHKDSSEGVPSSQTSIHDATWVSESSGSTKSPRQISTPSSSAASPLVARPVTPPAPCPTPIDPNSESPLSQIAAFETPFLYGHGTELAPIAEQRSRATLRSNGGGASTVSTSDISSLLKHKESGASTLRSRRSRTDDGQPGSSGKSGENPEPVAVRAGTSSSSESGVRIPRLRNTSKRHSPPVVETVDVHAYPQRPGYPPHDIPGPKHYSEIPLTAEEEQEYAVMEQAFADRTAQCNSGARPVLRPSQARPNSRRPTPWVCKACRRPADQRWSLFSTVTGLGRGQRRGSEWCSRCAWRKVGYILCCCEYHLNVYPGTFI